MFEMEQTLNLMEFLEACPETFRLAKMNLAVRGISHNLGPKNQSTFEQDFHRGTKMDYIIATPAVQPEAKSAPRSFAGRLKGAMNEQVLRIDVRINGAYHNGREICKCVFHARLWPYVFGREICKCVFHAQF